MQALAILSAAGLARDALKLVAGAVVLALLALAFSLASLAALLAPSAPTPASAQAGARPDGRAARSSGPGAPGAGGGYDWVVRFGFARPYGAAQFSASLPIHRGVDIQVAAAPDGGRGLVYTPFQPGVVVAVTSDPFGGNGVIVQLASGLYTRYFHNAAVLARAGQVVDTSTPLATLGDSGSPGFPHVHFEVSRTLNGDPVGALIDPRPFMGSARP